MKRTVKSLLLVLLVAVALTIGIRVMLAGKPAPQSAPPSERMLVAAAELPPGLLLRGSEFVWQAVTADAVPKEAILQHAPQAGALSGALLRHAVARGAPIRDSDIIRSGAPGFLAAALKPGLRAVSVAITDVSGNAGLIQPDDHIDLLLTQTMRDSKTPSSAVASETIAMNMRVIAVGSSLRRPNESADGAAPNGVGPARTITLEVTPHTAEAIAVAARLGELSMSLRSFAIDAPAADDSASTPATGTEHRAGSTGGPVWAGDISQATRSIGPARAEAASPPPSSSGAPARRGVLILRGSTEVKVDTPALANLNAAPHIESLNSKAPQ